MKKQTFNEAVFIHLGLKPHHCLVYHKHSCGFYDEHVISMYVKYGPIRDKIH